MTIATATGSGLALCPTCHLLVRRGASHNCCPRCGCGVDRDRRTSIARTWALLLAAYLLYLPANLLPIMQTRSLGGVQNDTILSGVAYLWSSGAWVLAIIVFVASVAVPLLKLFVLTGLLLSVQWRMRIQARQRTGLYRLLEAIGRWSMLDVFVVAVLVALVQAQSLASMLPGPGVLAFAAVVVLSMLATMAFDPRLIWEADATDLPPDHPT